MKTVFQKLNATYTVANESDKLKMEGQLTYSSKIDNMSLGVHTVEGEYLGNISYSEYGEDQNSMSCNVNMIYMMDAISLLNVIINDAKSELVE